jgi:hypothetical protein
MRAWIEWLNIMAETHVSASTYAKGYSPTGVDEWSEQEPIRLATDKYLIGSGQESLVQECIQKLLQSQDMRLPSSGELEKMFKTQRAAERSDMIRWLGRRRFPGGR